MTEILHGLTGGNIGLFEAARSAHDLIAAFLRAELGI